CSGRAVIAGARAPEPVAAPRPVADIPAADAHDIADAIAIHVGNPNLPIIERDGQPARWQAVLYRVGENICRGCSGAPGVSELPPPTRVATEGQERLELGPGAHHGIEQAVEVRIHNLGLSRVPTEVELYILPVPGRDGAAGPPPHPRRPR